MGPQCRCFMFLNLSYHICKLEKNKSYQENPHHLYYTNLKVFKNWFHQGSLRVGGRGDLKKVGKFSEFILWLGHSVPSLQLLPKWPSFHSSKGWTFPAQIGRIRKTPKWGTPFANQRQWEYFFPLWSSDKALEVYKSNIKHFLTSVRISTIKPYPSRQILIRFVVSHC